MPTSAWMDHKGSADDNCALPEQLWGNIVGPAPWVVRWRCCRAHPCSTLRELWHVTHEGDDEDAEEDEDEEVVEDDDDDDDDWTEHMEQRRRSHASPSPSTSVQLDDLCIQHTQASQKELGTGAIDRLRTTATTLGRLTSFQHRHLGRKVPRPSRIDPRVDARVHLSSDRKCAFVLAASDRMTSGFARRHVGHVGLFNFCWCACCCCSRRQERPKRATRLYCCRAPARTGASAESWLVSDAQTLWDLQRRRCRRAPGPWFGTAIRR